MQTSSPSPSSLDHFLYHSYHTNDPASSVTINKMGINDVNYSFPNHFIHLNDTRFSGAGHCYNNYSLIRPPADANYCLISTPSDQDQVINLNDVNIGPEQNALQRQLSSISVISHDSMGNNDPCSATTSCNLVTNYADSAVISANNPPLITGLINSNNHSAMINDMSVIDNITHNYRKINNLINDDLSFSATTSAAADQNACKSMADQYSSDNNQLRAKNNNDIIINSNYCLMRYNSDESYSYGVDQSTVHQGRHNKKMKLQTMGTCCNTSTAAATALNIRSACNSSSSVEEDDEHQIMPAPAPLTAAAAAAQHQSSINGTASAATASGSKSGKKRSRNESSSTSLGKGASPNPNPNSSSNSETPQLAPGVIHVRARRGEATDSHSLAERVRRERISQRMKLLQDLVPSCSKVLGKAAMLEEIINYVKSLQHQIEFLSMKLAASNPTTMLGGQLIDASQYNNMQLPEDIYGAKDN